MKSSKKACLSSRIVYGIVVPNLTVQPEQRSQSWLATIRVQRRETQTLLSENPSLKPDLEEALQNAYTNGRDLASGEANLRVSTFPNECLYTLEEILNDRFYPGEPATDDLMK